MLLLFIGGENTMLDKMNTFIIAGYISLMTSMSFINVDDIREKICSDPKYFNLSIFIISTIIIILLILFNFIIIFNDSKMKIPLKIR